MFSHVCFCMLCLDANPIPLEFIDVLQKDAAEPFLILLLPHQMKYVTEMDKWCTVTPESTINILVQTSESREMWLELVILALGWELRVECLDKSEFARQILFPEIHPYDINLLGNLLLSRKKNKNPKQKQMKKQPNKKLQTKQKPKNPHQHYFSILAYILCKIFKTKQKKLVSAFLTKPYSCEIPLTLTH